MPGRGKDGTVVQLSGAAELLTRLQDRAIGFIDDWFGPWSPPPEATGAGAVEGRAFDFPTGWNLRRPPRQEDGIASVTELRALADASELVRLCIETRKDITAKAQWTIQPRALFGESEFEASKRGKDDPRIEKLYNFMRFPDGEHDFATWIRMILEDALVLDAATIYCRRNKAGGVRSLEVVDGGTITRYLDATGRTPGPPLPAFGQWIKGVPYKNYSIEDLVYMPRNPRVHKVYGMSPVEQIILHCNIMLNRNITQLATYQYSNVPRMFLKSPPDWKPADLKDFKVWFDAALTGDLIERSKVIPIPSGTDPYEPKKDVLKDESDEWFARVVCYCFGVPPNFFIRQQNRAGSESMMIQADEEGALPWLNYLKSYIDRIFSNWMGVPDLEFAWEWDRKPQPLQASQIHQVYLQNKVLTPDEVREEIGYDPLTAAQKEELNPEPPPMGPVTADGKPLNAPITVKAGVPGKPKPKDDSASQMVNKLHDVRDDKTGQYEALDLIGDHYDDLMNMAESHAVEGKGINSAAAIAAAEAKRGRPLSAKARAAARDAYSRHYYRTRGIDVSKVAGPKKFGY